MKILIVEDDFLSRRLLHKYLASFGEVDIAVNGKEALDAVKLGFDEHHPYDLVCLDIMMPEMDGLCALRKIRQLEAALKGVRPKTRMKIIMATALSDKERVIEAAKANCDAYLIKPITQTRIVEELAKFGFFPQSTPQTTHA